MIHHFNNQFIVDSLVALGMTKLNNTRQQVDEQIQVQLGRNLQLTTTNCTFNDFQDSNTTTIQPAWDLLLYPTAHDAMVSQKLNNCDANVRVVQAVEVFVNGDEIATQCARIDGQIGRRESQ